jgi:hypothetical protein
MLDPYSAVIVYDSGQEGPELQEPAYCVIGHNLNGWDANRLADRLVKQYQLNAHVIRHRNHHPETNAQECEGCQLLFKEIIERASRAAVVVEG